jgi:cytochrome b561
VPQAQSTVPDARPQPDAILRYGNGAIFLHWLTALVLVAQVIIGFTFHLMPRGPARGEWFTWHKTIGATILLLAIIRLAWRLAHKPPSFPESLPAWERIAATWNHRLFYALLILLPLTGLVAISGGADTATTGLVGGLSLPLVPGISDGGGEISATAHVVLVFTTLALLVLHIAAALKHQFFDASRAAGRMPPFRTRDGAPTIPAN